jgi:hypothetical protein
MYMYACAYMYGKKHQAFTEELESDTYEVYKSDGYDVHESDKYNVHGSDKYKYTKVTNIKGETRKGEMRAGNT